jgi:hypothetical protein
MKPECERLIQASNDFLELLEALEIGPLMRRSRFYEPCLRRGWPWRIVPEYVKDYEVIQGFDRALRDSRAKANKGKFLVFDSLAEPKFVSETELESIDTEKATLIIERLRAFRIIYRMELALANAYVPYVELGDELDSVIEDFGIAPDMTIVSRVMELRGKLRRRGLQTQVSAVLAVMSLALITGKTNLADFLLVGIVLALILLFIIFPLMSKAIWTSFRPLLSET